MAFTHIENSGKTDRAVTSVVKIHQVYCTDNGRNGIGEDVDGYEVTYGNGSNSWFTNAQFAEYFRVLTPEEDTALNG